MHPYQLAAGGGIQIRNARQVNNKAADPGCDRLLNLLSNTKSESSKIILPVTFKIPRPSLAVEVTSMILKA